MKTYIIRWKPVSYCPGNDTRETIVKAANPKEALRLLPSITGESFSHHMIWEAVE